METYCHSRSFVSSGDQSSTYQVSCWPPIARRGAVFESDVHDVDVVAHAIARVAVEREPLAVVRPHGRAVQRLAVREQARGFVGRAVEIDLMRSRRRRVLEEHEAVGIRARSSARAVLMGSA